LFLAQLHISSKENYVSDQSIVLNDKWRCGQRA
jgi:hypothetical protein